MDRPLEDRQALAGDLSHAAHVWLLSTDNVDDAGIYRNCAGILSEEEGSRYRRFRFDADRELYLLSHAMLRRVLSQYSDVEPELWKYRQNEYGRPEIVSPDPGLQLRFNLTHTRGLAACVVTDTHDCGIDAEAIVARRNVSGIAERMFADDELRMLQQLDGQPGLERFITLWTLREAYSKACGKGLAHAGGNHFRFEHCEDVGWCIHFADDGRHDDGWHFTVERIADTHMIAVALHAPGSAVPGIRFMEFSF